MGCQLHPLCGGCTGRDLPLEQYRAAKAAKVRHILDTGLTDKDYIWEEPVFIEDGGRRRAALAFCCKKGQITLGFNAAESSEICDCRQCLMLTPALNAELAPLKDFLEKFCAVKSPVKTKAKSKPQKPVQSGDVLILQADNGLDIVLEADISLSLDHRLEISDYVNSREQIIRFSHRRKSDAAVETVMEKTKPLIHIGGYEVQVAPGTFLQASKAGEEALIKTVMRYLGETHGHIADLFCGIGTFTYALAAAGNKVDAYDSNESLLEGFRTSVNRQMLNTVSVYKKNLFKDPLEARELSRFDAVVFDPPRAGAAAQVKELAKLHESTKPEKIIAVSCNPHSFVNDADTLISGGYKLRKVTLIDQFVYSAHSELVALFTR